MNELTKRVHLAGSSEDLSFQPEENKRKITFSRLCRICLNEKIIYNFFSCCGTASCNDCLFAQLNKVSLRNRLCCSYCRRLFPFKDRVRLAALPFNYGTILHDELLDSYELELFGMIARLKDVKRTYFEEKNIDVNAVNTAGYSFISSVCRYNPVNITTLETLLDCGADPDEGQALKTLIQKNFDKNAFELLLSKGHADPNVIDPTGRTPLHLAVSNNNLGAVEMLLKYGAKTDFDTLCIFQK